LATLVHGIFPLSLLALLWGMWRYPLLRFQFTPESWHALHPASLYVRLCSSRVIPLVPPLYWDKFSHCFTPTLASNPTYYYFEGCQGPIHFSQADGPQHMRADLSVFSIRVAWKGQFYALQSMWPLGPHVSSRFTPRLDSHQASVAWPLAAQNA
jgi:hypothetical protein